MFHKWTLVRAEPKVVDRYVDHEDFRKAPFNVTDLYYVCGRVNCHKTKIVRIDGHWTYEELMTYNGSSGLD